MKITITTLIFLFYFGLNLFSQSSISDSSIDLSIVGINYGLQLPGGDLKDRFGYNSVIGIDYTYKTKKQWEFGAQYQYMFGNQVKDTGMLTDITTESGGIINVNGQFAFVNTFQRGHHLALKGGYLVGGIGPNKNCGFYINAGVGLLIHKVKFINQNEDIPQFNINDKEYLPGYDRYTSGVSLTQNIGYRYLSNNGLINFYIGLQFTQAFTKIRRNYQVDYPIDFEKKQRTDLLNGIQIGWILPIYKKPSKDFYY